MGMPTRTVLKPRTDSRTTAILSRLPSHPPKWRARSQLTTKLSLREPSTRLFPGWMPISQQRRRSTKRSKSHWKELPCQSSRPWVVEPVLLQVECQELAVCLISEVLHQVEPLLLMILPLDPLLRRSIKRHNVGTL